MSQTLDDGAISASKSAGVAFADRCDTYWNGPGLMSTSLR